MSVFKHSELVLPDGNSLVRQHNTGINLTDSSSVNEIWTDSTTANMSTTMTSPYWNLTADQKMLCADLVVFNLVRLYVDLGLIGPLCVAGIVGNMLAILALRLDTSNRTVTFLLQSLAVADNAYLISSLLVQTLKSVTECTSWLQSFKKPYAYCEIYLWPLASIAQTTTVWLTVLVTVDRFVAICRPFESMRHHVSARAKRAVYIIVLGAVVYNIPRFFEKEVQYLPDHCNRVHKYIARNTSLQKNKIYKLIYKTIFFLVFRMVGPLSVLVVLNMKLISTLRRARRDHAQLTQSANQRSNNYFNLILVAVVTVFIICQTPDLILRIIVTIKTYGNLRVNTSWPNIFTNLMLTVNSSVNCVIYCLTGRRFQQILYRLLCKRAVCCRGRHRDDVTYGNGESQFSITNNRGRGTSMSAVNETCL